LGYPHVALVTAVRNLLCIILSHLIFIQKWYIIYFFARRRMKTTICFVYTIRYSSCYYAMFVLFIAILYLTSVRTLKMKVTIIMVVMRITMELIGLKLNL